MEHMLIKDSSNLRGEPIFRQSERNWLLSSCVPLVEDGEDEVLWFPIRSTYFESWTERGACTMFSPDGAWGHGSASSEGVWTERNLALPWRPGVRCCFGLEIGMHVRMDVVTRSPCKCHIKWHTCTGWHCRRFCHGPCMSIVYIGVWACMDCPERASHRWHTFDLLWSKAQAKTLHRGFFAPEGGFFLDCGTPSFTPGHVLVSMNGIVLVWQFHSISSGEWWSPLKQHDGDETSNQCCPVVAIPLSGLLFLNLYLPWFPVNFPFLKSIHNGVTYLSHKSGYCICLQFKPLSKSQTI